MQKRLVARARAVNIGLMAPLLGLAVFLVFFASLAPSAATAATSSNLNFQARLLNNLGGVVPDGNYNIDFKLYTADGTTGTVGSCSGACVWEETRTNAAGNGVKVVNGYFSVNLGSVTSFPSNINWDQQLWLTMNITTNGTQTGAPTTGQWNGEMQNAGHSIALTALPFAFVSGQLAKTSGANRGTLGFNTVANNPNLILPDVASGTLCVQGSTACNFINNQTSVQTANFNIQSASAGSIAAIISGTTGQMADIFQVKMDGVTDPAFAISGSGAANIKVNSTSAFQVQNATNDSLFKIDSTNSSTSISTSTINIGANAASHTIHIGDGTSGFPSGSTLDNFNRANGAVSASPASGGDTWSTVNITGDAVSRLTINTNAATGVNSGTFNSSFLNTNYGPNSEAYATVTTVGNTGTNEVAALYLRMGNAGTTNATAYELNVLGNGTWQLWRMHNSSTFVTLGSSFTQALSAGDSIGFRVTGTTTPYLEAWYKPSAGSWTQLSTYTDNFSVTPPGSQAPFLAAGKIALEIYGQAPRLDNLGGGTIGGAQSIAIGSANATSDLYLRAGTGSINLLPTGGGNTGVIVKPGTNSTAAFQVQNSANSKAVMTVDTTNNLLMLGAPGAGGITGGIKLFYAGSTGSITLAMSDPGASNYTLTIPSGGGTICTTANGLCSGGGTGTGGLAKNAPDTSSADAGVGYLYTFSNSGNAGTGGVLSLDNGNNTGAALFMKATSSKALQLQNSSSFNALVADTSGTYTHLKIYDGTTTQAYADIYYDDAAGAAIFTASAGKAQFGGGSVPTLITAGTSQALTITGHASSSWTLDSGDLTIDVTGTTPNMNIGTGATAKTINIGNQTSTTATIIKSGTGNINLNPVGTSDSGVLIKPQNASTLALQIQNSTTSKVVMSVDNSANQVVIGDSSASGITGKLAFSVAGASGKIILTPSTSPGASTFTLQLPSENGTLCTTAGSAACLAVYGGGVGGTFLAKDATDTSSADSGAGALYTFTNSGIAGSGSVLKLNNGNNTGSTLSLTTTGNPDSGKALIYAENKNAAPSGNLLDLEAGSTPASVFSVDAAGNVVAAGQATVLGTTLDGSSLIFGAGGNPSLVEAATSQALNITANASSLWQVGGTDQNLTIQTSGTGTLSLDTTGAGTVNIGNTNADSINIGANSSTITIGGGNYEHTIHIGDQGTGGLPITVSIGSAVDTSTTTISAGEGAINFNSEAAMFTESDFARLLGVRSRSANVAGTNFTIQAGAGGSGASAVGGGTLSLVGGSAAGTGNANGGNVNISGGTGIGSGATGLVVLNTPAFATTTADPNCYTGGAPVSASCTISQSSVDGSAAVIVGFFNNGQTASLPDPTITTPGKLVYITAASNSEDFTLSVNGGGAGNQIAMRKNTSATMIWSGSDWTAAGASSSTTLQAAYDNTLQSAGGAELVVSHTGATNGLTIRDSITNPVNGTLLSVQAASASTLFSVNDSVAEYASDGGAEVAGGTSSTFPANSWSGIGSATVSRFTTVGNFIATGQASASVVTTAAAGDGVTNKLSGALTANVHYNVSFAVRLASGTFPQMAVYYSVDGTAQSVACASGQTVPTSVWKKINCAFQAPASGITASNAILIQQTTSGTARTFYVDNISVTIAADFNYATDGGVDDSTNFATNWSAVAGSTVTRSTSTGNDASDSAQVVTTGAGQGIRNKLAVNLLTNTLYRVSVYAASSTAGFDNFTVRYSRDGGTNFTLCADYNTQSVSSLITTFTQITCYINTDNVAATNPYVYFTQTDATGRTFYVDTFSITLTTNTAPNIQIGGGVNGGPVALFTLDRAAAAPIAANNDALLGSMYYDTTLGKLQCYEADGWGACGSSPDNIVTISPEYTNAVMHGTGVGTMTSDICSSTLHINDGFNPGDPTICGTNETFNFYKWTSPQATPQTYSIYVTYQLPDTFKSFASGQTSIMGRTDSSNATVAYEVFRNSSTTGLTQCGPTVAVSSGSVSSWQPGPATGAADPSTCGFAPSDSIVFKINMTASQGADAYVGNLNFTFSNK